jgi:hypothetical protein
MVHCKIGDDTLLIHNIRYIPDLAETIYSLFLHIQSPGHGLQSSFEKELFILSSSFKTKAILGTNDIYLDAVPTNLTGLSDHVSLSTLIIDPVLSYTILMKQHLSLLPSLPLILMCLFIHILHPM